MALGCDRVRKRSNSVTKHIFKEINMFVAAERFLLNIFHKYRKLPVSTECGDTGYPTAR